MSSCSDIKADGGRCGAQAIRDSSWCFNHHPDYEEQRRRRASRGGRRGGRGRPVSELGRLQARFEELAEMVLEGKLERSVGAVAGQLLNGARACMATRLKAVEQEELIERLAELESLMETRRRGSA